MLIEIRAKPVAIGGQGGGAAGDPGPPRHHLVLAIKVGRRVVCVEGMGLVAGQGG